ncbi:hypothetical protein [Paenibacillus sp. GbtcB18]|uniref:hypothetical protein n=1 Tax=Paenibacillus sp. GbtcB18 TaxID=2824763 RepID=UPI001C308BB4|nr:hypothetical protein [Paenibacillus sp. GbtcB18]
MYLPDPGLTGSDRFTAWEGHLVQSVRFKGDDGIVLFFVHSGEWTGSGHLVYAVKRTSGHLLCRIDRYKTGRERSGSFVFWKKRFGANLQTGP